jgi:hypothetical protein
MDKQISFYSRVDEKDAKSMVKSDSHVNQDKKELTYTEYVRSRISNTVVLAREMENALGKEQAHEIIRNAFHKDMEEGVKEDLKDIGPVKTFADFVRIEKEDNESPDFKKILALTYPHESPTELSLHVTKCLHAEAFKELNAEELGYLIVCNPDHAYAQACHPNIKLKRSKTLMQGDSFCNHTWYWDEASR